jgi:hypothetical protein
MGKNTTEISYKSLELLMQEMIKRFSLSKKGVDVNFLEGWNILKLGSFEVVIQPILLCRASNMFELYTDCIFINCLKVLL